MFKSLYRRLALSSLKRHKNIFIPFVGTGIFLMVLTGLCISLLGEESLKGQGGMAQMGMILYTAVIVMLFFSALTLFSTYSFIQKRKLKESGLFLILGLEKKHLRKVLSWEMLYLFLMIAIPGLVFSALLHKLSLGIFVKITKMNIDPLGEGIIPTLEPLFYILLAYLGIFLFILVAEMLQTSRFTPIGLINEARAGDKKESFPRVKALMGILCLLIGYGISIFTKNPMHSITMFLPAVILVIIGTYLAFTTIISWLLNALKAKKEFYYKKENFASISGLLYRVKNSSKSLANIAILSTAVMVIFTSGLVLFLGIEERVNLLIPQDYVATVYKSDKGREEIESYIKKYIKDNKLKSEVKSFQFLQIPAKKKENRLYPLKEEKEMMDNQTKVVEFIYAPQANLDFKEADYIYAKKSSKDRGVKLYEEEKIQNRENISFLPTTHQIMGMDVYRFYVKDPLILRRELKNYVGDKDLAVIEKHIHIHRKGEGRGWNDFAYKVRKEVQKDYPDLEFQIRDRDVELREMQMIYGGIFYVGVLLGLAFLVSTGISIYYKQLTVGYADIDRFRILRQVGMTDEEAKKTIQKQIRLVFILPLFFALMHTSFAYPILRHILLILGMFSDFIFIISLGSVFLVFSIFYFTVYKMTESVYKNLVLR